MADKPTTPPPSTNGSEDGDAQLRTLNEKKSTQSSGDTKPRLLEDIDQMTAQELADYLYALAEEIIASPQEYKIKMGLEKLDIADLDNIDLNTPQGRKKLAALLRLLAEQVFQSKEKYQVSVVDKSQSQGRGR